MKRFITRVELHGAGEQDYVNLHEAMERMGFARKIWADTRIWYYLPTAEYVYTGNITNQEVFNMAQRAANSTGRNSWILVAESVNITFQLAQVR
ncbi:MAG: hypothetical protein KGJ13_11265 [Patescibacteria group bacterium]|nr:hypothetical protein [Patescibacteria group bacterium]